MTNLDLGLDFWRHWVGCHLYNYGWHDESSPSTHLTMSSNNSSVSPSTSSSSGESYFYLAWSSPIRINPNLQWPGWPAGQPQLTTPDPDSSSLEHQSHFDWDPRTTVLTEVSGLEPGLTVLALEDLWRGKSKRWEAGGRLLEEDCREGVEILSREWRSR